MLENFHTYHSAFSLKPEHVISKGSVVLKHFSCTPSSASATQINGTKVED